MSDVKERLQEAASLVSKVDNTRDNKTNRRRRYTESMGTIGDAPGVRERMDSIRELLGGADGFNRPCGVPGAQEDPSSIAGMFAESAGNKGN